MSAAAASLARFCAAQSYLITLLLPLCTSLAFLCKLNNSAALSDPPGPESFGTAMAVYVHVQRFPEPHMVCAST